MLGTVLRQRGDVDDALAEFRRAVEPAIDARRGAPVDRPDPPAAWPSRRSRARLRRAPASEPAQGRRPGRHLRRRRRPREAGAQGDVDGARAQFERGRPPRRRQPAGALRSSRCCSGAQGQAAGGPGPLRRGAAAGAVAPPLRKACAHERSESCPIAALRGARDVGVARAQAPAAPAALPFAFAEVGREAGLTRRHRLRRPERNRYLLETTGCGVALFDYDGDGWLDVFLVNGTTLEGFPPGREPTDHLYRNRGDGTFEDVTDRAGSAARPAGARAPASATTTTTGARTCSSPTGARTACSATAGPDASRTSPRGPGSRRARRWGTGCAFLDYDRDGRLDLFVANYIDLDLEPPPTPGVGPVPLQGRAGGLRAARPPRRQERALPQPRRRHASRTCRRRAGITKADGTYGLGVSTLDFDDDGWIDLYVANDSNPSALYRNNRDGTFTDVAVRAGCAYSQDGKPQAGMGVARRRLRPQRHHGHLQDELRGRHLDALRQHRRRLLRGPHVRGGHRRQHALARAGASGFVDLDNDGWLDVFLVNGHVYPEVAQLAGEAGYKQRKVVYRNPGTAGFEDVTERLGPPLTDAARRPGRRLRRLRQRRRRGRRRQQRARHAGPLPARSRGRARHWLHGRSCVGTRVEPQRDRRARPVRAGGRALADEVRGGGSYVSQNDLRVHFGLGAATRVDRLEVRWPNGLEETFAADGVDRQVHARRRARAGHERWPGASSRCVLARRRGGRAGPAPPRRCGAQPRWPRPRRLIDAGRAGGGAGDARAPRRDRGRGRASPAAGVALYHADRPAPPSRPSRRSSPGLPTGSIERREAVQVLGLRLYLAGRLAEAVP